MPGTGLTTDRLSVRRAGRMLLDGVSLAASSGSLLAVLGGAGAGKSALMGVLSGAVAPASGAAMLHGVDLRRSRPHRRGFGVVAQQDALFARLTLAQNVAYPLRLRGVGRRDRTRLVEAACDSVLLTGAGRLPHQASAADRQRAWIARATVFGPSVLLLDDPLSQQPAEERPLLVAALGRIHAMLGATTILATRVPADALALGGSLAVLAGGRLIQSGSPETVYDRPGSAQAALACGEANLLPGKVRSIDEDGVARVALSCGPDSWGMAVQGLRDGAACVLCLRPERIAVAPTSASEMGEDAVDAVVLEALHLGETVRLRLLLGAGEALLVKRPAAAGLRGLRPGEGVAIAWQPAHATIFPAAS
jgi:putative spermidine/putrescine transport system ATP-binding protein